MRNEIYAKLSERTIKGVRIVISLKQKRTHPIGYALSKKGRKATLCTY